MSNFFHKNVLTLTIQQIIHCTNLPLEFFQHFPILFQIFWKNKIAPKIENIHRKLVNENSEKKLMFQNPRILKDKQKKLSKQLTEFSPLLPFASNNLLKDSETLRFVEILKFSEKFKQI